jgi:HAD superfamily hydrolase (TIGR01662 family)
MPAQSPIQRPFEYILFDLGDTLIYFDGSPEVMVHASMAVACYLQKSLGHPVDEKGFARQFGERLHAYYRERDADFIEDTTETVLRSMLIEQGYSDIPPRQIRAALNEMYGITQSHWQPEDDAIPTLQTLCAQGYHIGLISNAADAQDVQCLVDKAGLRPYLELILISAVVGIRKPHPRIFQLALEHWQATPDQAVMVGDTLGADILGGLNAGIATIWITRRANTRDNNDQKDIIQADAVVTRLQDIPELLAHWQR